MRPSISRQGAWLADYSSVHSIAVCIYLEIVEHWADGAILVFFFPFLLMYRASVVGGVGELTTIISCPTPFSLFVSYLLHGSTVYQKKKRKNGTFHLESPGHRFWSGF